MVSVLVYPARFYRKTIPEPNSGCLLWTGTYDRNGYGHVTINGRRVQSHRVALMLAGVTVALTDKVLHRCDTPACVNPDHLFIGTQQDNVDDMHAKGRGRMVPAERLRAKTQCPRGHAYDRLKPQGWRKCGLCAREQQRTRRAQRRAA